MDEFIIKDGKKLRLGFTTGTCATAASKAATIMLLTDEKLDSVSVDLPKGKKLEIALQSCELKAGIATCCVKKFSGDDPYVTNGILVYSSVKFNNDGNINIDGGKGVGTVTKKGLDCPVGGAAINSMPRKMITNNVNQLLEDFSCEKGVDVLIEVPEGEEIAKRTFNSHLGIIGGISIIGTSGIVEPMSKKALVDSLKIEMNVIKEKSILK
ncbi:MAG: cobalt-precorrin-5B (C(1))-methyltransferase [Peptostreptococcaceae bacterium]|nr:cobalt-precorrin-5B (C(1))-methyltransferase CbiD [uncultured Criibacterium sp.]MBS6062330.1 cobalt-precorrin-5B (C(1))-methyltransferase [Peptostreptococcaceae bacterium]